MYRSSAILYRFPEIMPTCISVFRTATLAVGPMDNPWIPAIRRLMAAKGWKQRDLSDASGVRANTLSDLLSGTSSRIETFAALAEALGVPLWALFCGEHEYALFSERAKQEDTATLQAQKSAAAADLVIEKLRPMIVALTQGDPVPAAQPVIVKRKVRR